MAVTHDEAPREPNGGDGSAAPGEDAVTVRVLLFAQLAADAGWRSRSESLPAGSTAGDLLERLAQREPSIATLRGALALAIGTRYVSAEAALADGDEVALIPPVSGG